MPQDIVPSLMNKLRLFLIPTQLMITSLQRLSAPRDPADVMEDPPIRGEQASWRAYMDWESWLDLSNHPLRLARCNRTPKLTVTKPLEAKTLHKSHTMESRSVALLAILVAYCLCVAFVKAQPQVIGDEDEYSNQVRLFIFNMV